MEYKFVVNASQNGASIIVDDLIFATKDLEDGINNVYNIKIHLLPLVFLVFCYVPAQSLFNEFLLEPLCHYYLQRKVKALGQMINCTFLTTIFPAD